MTDASQLQFEAQKVQMEVIKEIGFMGYRFLITLNSGAFIVLLTFIGNIEGSAAFAMNLSSLKTAMWCFLAAIFWTFVAMTIAYISAQVSLLGGALPGAKHGTGHVLWLLSPVVIAFLCFCLGGYFAISGISSK
jgi:hypothetical protein